MEFLCRSQKVGDKMAYDGSIKIDSSIDGTGFQSGLKNLGSMAAKGLAAITAAVSAGVVALGKQAVSAYADYEQLVGGVETLFKNSASLVEKYADNAFKTAGMSANTYMENVTSFSASLLQSLGGDTEAAAKVADMAITDMSDNANKMGTDIGRITDAYQGFAKQNYTMLDNLKLGYGGTKTEMERLLADAQKITGIKYDINNLNDVFNAIHVIQGGVDELNGGLGDVNKGLGITGTTAKEASTTIQGSASAMKAAWTNMLVGLADDTQDFDGLLDNLIESVGTFAENIMPRVETALGGIAKFVAKLAPQIAAELPGLMADIMPEMTQAVKEVIKSLLDGIGEVAPILSPITSAISFLVENFESLLAAVTPLAIGFVAYKSALLAMQAPAIAMAAITEIQNAAFAIQAIQALGAKGAMELFSGTTKGATIAQWLLNAAMSANPIGIVVMAIAALVAAVVILWNTNEDFRNALIAIWGNIKATIGAAVEVLVGFFTKTIPGAWNNLASFFTAEVPKIIAGILLWFGQLPDKIWAQLVKVISKVKAWSSNLQNTAKTEIPKFVQYVVSEIGKLPGKMLDIGKNIVHGIWDGITGAARWLGGKISGFVSGIVDGFKGGFDINSPSRVMADEIGRFLPPGITVGMDKAMPAALQDMKTQMVAMMEQARATISAEQARLGATFNAQSTYQLAYAGGAAQTQDSAETPSFFIENHLIMNDRELAVAAGPAFAKELGWKGGKK